MRGQTRRMAPQRVTFYGGPADGGELLLAEPLRAHLHFPISHADALELLEVTGETKAGGLIPNHVECDYVLELKDGQHPRRDPHGRLRYLYVVATTPSKEK